MADQDFSKAASKALAALGPQQSRSSVVPTTPRTRQLAAMRDATAESLKPAETDDFRNHLTACLILTAPSGMSKDDRNEWLRAAWLTIGHLPADLLKRGCEVARRTADHPSKIVPAILGDAEAEIRRRKRTISECSDDIELIETQIRAELEQRAADERGRQIAMAAPKSLAPPPNHSGRPVNPTRADYIAMGVDPAVIDQIEAENAQKSAA